MATGVVVIYSSIMHGKPSSDTDARRIESGEARNGTMTPVEYTRKYPRKSFADDLGIPVTVIQFGKLHRQDITVTGHDISEGGMGVLSDTPLAPGFVWFWRQVGPQKGGMIVWSRKIDNQYRAGIQFLPIPMSPNEYLKEST